MLSSNNELAYYFLCFKSDSCFLPTPPRSGYYDYLTTCNDSPIFRTPLRRPLIDFALGRNNTLMNLYNIRFTSCV